MTMAHKDCENLKVISDEDVEDVEYRKVYKVTNYRRLELEGDTVIRVSDTQAAVTIETHDGEPSHRTWKLICIPGENIVIILRLPRRGNEEMKAYWIGSVASWREDPAGTIEEFTGMSIAQIAAPLLSLPT